MGRPVVWLALGILVAGCEYGSSGFGVVSDGRTLSAVQEASPSGIYIAGYRLALSDGTECTIPIKYRDWLNGVRDFPISCTNGENGMAHISLFATSTITSTANISFRLTSGATGQATVTAGAVV